MSISLIRAAQRRVAKAPPVAGTIPFRWLRVYDDSAPIPATPTTAPTGVLLLEIDLTGSSWIGTTSVQLSSTIAGTVLAIGFPRFMRLVSADGLTATDIPYALALNAPDSTHEIVDVNPPDDAVDLYPGQWMAGTPVEFHAGDVVYTP